MAAFTRKPRSIAHLLLSLNKSQPFFPCPKPIHSQPNLESSVSVSQICDLLTNGVGRSWDTLTTNLSSIQLTETLVERVLLTLREPIHARHALTFFHWSSHNRRFRHGLRSYCLAIHILARAGLVKHADALLESALSKQAHNDEPSKSLVMETMLSMYELAVSGPKVFDLLVQRYARMRMVELAFDACCFFENHSFSLTLSTYNTVLRAAQKSDENDLAWKVFEYMIGRRVYPNQRSIEVMVDVMCKEGSLQRVLNVLDRIHGKKCAPGVVVNTSLGLKIFEEERADAGVVLLKRLLQKNLILDGVVNSLVIFGHCKMGRLDAAYELYSDMVKRGFGPNAFVHTSFIGASCKEGRIEEAIRLVEEMVSLGLKPYDDTYNFLIEGCHRIGRLEDSVGFYEKMLKEGFVPDCVTFNGMIGRLCEAGEADKANKFLTDLLGKGFVLNEETYAKLIDGFGKIGNAQEILKLYYEMGHKGLSPGAAIYMSLVSNLSRCGKLNEAERFLNTLEEKFSALNGGVYDAMIHGYSKKGDTERALYFYDKMIRKELKPCSNNLVMLARGVLKVNSTECDNKVLEIFKSCH